MTKINWNFILLHSHTWAKLNSKHLKFRINDDLKHFFRDFFSVSHRHEPPHRVTQKIFWVNYNKNRAYFSINFNWFQRARVEIFQPENFPVLLPEFTLSRNVQWKLKISKCQQKIINFTCIPAISFEIWAPPNKHRKSNTNYLVELVVWWRDHHLLIMM